MINQKDLAINSPINNSIINETKGVPLTLQEIKIKSADGKYANIKSASSYNDFKNKSLYAIVKQLETTDSAFLNSVLAYSVYEKTSWISQNLHKEISEIVPYLKNAMSSEEAMYELKIWHFMKNTFEKIPDSEIGLPKQANQYNSYGYLNKFTFENGEYETDSGLAHASVLKSKNPNGDGYVLHLTFRGTEFSKLFDYIKGPYLDMSAYYSNFKPLEEAIKAYVNDPKNNIKELHVDGHSLGGSMVQEFLKNTPKQSMSIPVKGFTFGSPGSEKKSYHKFLTIAYHFFRGVDVPDQKGVKKDSRLHEFYHNNDPVPKVGLMGYNKSGEKYNLFDTVYKEAKEANLEKKGFLEKVPVFGSLVTYFKENVLNHFNTKFHDSSRYIKNIRNLIEEYFEAYPDLGTTIKGTAKNWDNWIQQEKKFSSLSIKYREVIKDIVKEENPTLDLKDVSKRILEIRDAMKYDSVAESVLASKRREVQGYEKFLNQASVDAYKENINNAVKEGNANVSKSLEKIESLRKTYQMVDSISKKLTKN